MKHAERLTLKHPTYHITYPLIRPSKLTSKERGGVGKELSNGWALNFAIGCTHGCVFCYVDSIHKRYGKHRYGDSVKRRWGTYFLVPENIDEAIEKTPWSRWEGEEVLLSSTHDPYLPQLAPIARKILERALPSGVKFCIQTRSPLVMKDFDILSRYKDQVRLQVSIATMNEEFSRLIEPNVTSPRARLEVIKRAKELGLETGVIVAPVFPPVNARPDVEADIDRILYELSKIGPDHVYGECLHVRGENVRLVEEVLGERVKNLIEFDRTMEKLFVVKLRKYDLNGRWWPEYRKR